MPATSYSRDELLAQMKRNPMKVLRIHCEQRTKGKREMEYTDLSVAFAGARAFKTDEDYRDEFEGDAFWPATFNFRESNVFAYHLMMIYGDTKGSAADRSYTHATALKSALADPSIDAEDIVELIKSSGGVRAMVDAQRAADRAVKNPLVAKPLKVAGSIPKNVWRVERQQEDGPGNEEDDLELGLDDFSENDISAEQAEPIVPRHKKVKAEKPEPKSTEQWREEKFAQLRKLAHQLGVLVVDPRTGVLPEVCAMRIGKSQKLVIERRENADQWADIVGLHLED